MVFKLFIDKNCREEVIANVHERTPLIDEIERMVLCDNISDQLPGYIGRDITDIPKSGGYVRTLVHEYGHTIQSIIFGSLYLLVIAIPSGLWCNLPQAASYRRKNRSFLFS